MAASKPTSPSKLPPQARRRVQKLVDLYEGEAYRTYNLALRITCEPGAAARATENAFLRYLAWDTKDAERERVLLQCTVQSAIAEAPKQGGRGGGPSARRRAGIGDGRMLEAAAVLSPSGRALLSLHSIGITETAAAAAIMGASTDATVALARQARKTLASELGVATKNVSSKLSDWSWEEPPTVIWDRLYPQAHRILAEPGGSSPAKAATSSPPRRRGGRRRRAAAPRAGGAALASRLPSGLRAARRLRPRDWLSGRAGVWAFRAAVVVIVLTPAAVIALASTGGKSASSLALSSSGGAFGGASGTGAATSADGGNYQGMSPKELDRLRLRELGQLRDYSKKQIDKSVASSQPAAPQPPNPKASAPAKLPKPVKPAPVAPAPAAPAPAPGKKRHKKRKPQRPPTTTTSPSVSDCIFNPDNGTYICPQS